MRQRYCLAIGLIACFASSHSYAQERIRRENAPIAAKLAEAANNHQPFKVQDALLISTQAPRQALS